MSLLDSFKVAGGVPEVEVSHASDQEPEQPTEITLDGYIQLQQLLRLRQRHAEKKYEDEISAIHAKMRAEQAIVDAYLKFDVAAASKAEDFDREKAASMAANASISEAIIDGLDADRDVANQKLSAIRAEYGRLETLLRSHAETLDTTRKSVAIEWIKGGGKLQLDRDHARRWLNSYRAARAWMTETFGDEAQEAIDKCLAQLGAYHVPHSTTETLYLHMIPREQEKYSEFAPQGEKQ